MNLLKIIFLQWPWEIANDLNELNLYHKNITYKRLRTSIKGREFGIMGNIVRKILFSIFRAPLIGEKNIKVTFTLFHAGAYSYEK